MHGLAEWTFRRYAPFRVPFSAALRRLRCLSRSPGVGGRDFDAALSLATQKPRPSDALARGWALGRRAAHLLASAAAGVRLRPKEMQLVQVVAPTRAPARFSFPPCAEPG